MRILVLITAVLLSQVALAQTSPFGTWKTIDDATGEAKSNVEIYEQDGALFGKITKILTDQPDAICEKCPGKRKNQPVKGMVIIENMKNQNDTWKNGKILDPESGKEYKCVIWVTKESKDVLKVRGKHWTGLYRTQTWYRVD